MKTKIRLAGMVLSVLLAAAVFGGVLADDHEHKKRKHGEHNRHQEEALEDAVPAAVNPLYRESCGACHFAYPPALLPGRSWKALLSRSGDHFGESLDLDPATLSELESFLAEGAAENVKGELPREILHSIGSGTPLRITEIPEIRKEHRKIGPAVFSRSAIGSAANCPACHPGADRGVFDDDAVRIPGR